MNRIALGTAQFGLNYGIKNRTGQVTRSQAQAMLKLATINNIDTLDTAITYGESEDCLGEIGIHEFKLVTKLPEFPYDCEDLTTWVQQQMSASLKRLGVSMVYGLILHKPEQLLDKNGDILIKALLRLKDGGQVQKLGVSIYSPSELDALMPRYTFDLVQAPFNLLDRRLKNTGWLYRLKDADIEVHTRSTFLQGLLLMKKEEMPTKFAPWSAIWQQWHKWLSESELTSLQACLSFSLSFPEIDRVVVGADSPVQLSEILSVKDHRFTNEIPDLQCDDERLINPSNWGSL